MSLSPAPSRAQTLRAAVPAALVAVLALAAAPAQIGTAWQRLRESPGGLARGAGAARRALYGDAYVDVVEDIRRRVPPDGVYAIAYRGLRGADQHWLRCDLAPRTPVLLRAWTCGGWYLDRSFAPVPEWAVLVSAEGTTRVVEARTLLTSLWSGLKGPEAEIPGWMDEPAEGAAVAGPVVVGGWCQERGGRPCVAVRVWLDGAELDAARIVRYPRPDVQAAVPGIGDCSRAGWRAAFAHGDLAPGAHCVAAALVAEDGRYRRVGPWAFTVTK